MSADARTIIHFTKSAEQLKGILSIGFKIKYCRERIMFGDAEKRFRVPVVSFCDIPVSQANENMLKYGSFGIGLTEAWAIKRGLTPVIYLEQRSLLAASLLKSLDLAVTNASNEVDPENRTSAEVVVLDLGGAGVNQNPTIRNESQTQKTRS